MNIKEIVKIKENLPNLLTKKIEEVHKVINKTRKERPKINITFRSLSQRQVLVSMNQFNSAKFMVLSNKHISNIKSVIVADFICAD